jgi:hypothetical protein
VVFFRPIDGSWQLQGCTTAVETDEPWVVDYNIILNPDWTTRRAEISSISTSGRRSTLLETDGAGRWLVAGAPAPQLDGCLDIDLESSAMTNALPVRRLKLQVGDSADSPAAYVRALDLSVERLEQTYTRKPDKDTHSQYDYTAPAFDFSCGLRYDEFGLVLAYPGIATRAS